jgi:hypothetical protein
MPRDLLTVNVRPRFYVPVNEQWETAVRSEHRMTAACLLNLIHWKWLCWRGDDDGYVRLKTAYLRRLLGQDALTAVRQSLVNGQVIDWDQTYQEGVRCMRYRLRPEYRETRLIHCDDERLTRRISRLRNEDEVRLLPVHRWLRERLLMLDFDIDRARSMIDGMLPDEDSPLMVKEYREILTEQLTRLNDQLANETPELTCDKYGRVHTAITRLPRSQRCCLAVDGQPLHGIDLANSQPLFLGIIARRFYTDRHVRTSLRKWKPLQKPLSYGRGTTPPHPPITMSGKSQMVETKEGYGNRLATVFGLELSGDDSTPRSSGLDEYLNHCRDGSLYERLMDPGDDRGRLKKKLFADVLYGRDNYPSPLRERFHKRYPAIGFMLSELKASEFRRPSWLMQHVESRLFIGRICGRIREQQPDIPLVTIHDSLLTTPAYVDYVEAVARSEFECLGVSPKFHRESY